MLLLSPNQDILAFSIKEYPMTRKKGKAVSFDAMVKFFMQNYNIPTIKDVDRKVAKLDRMKNLIKVAMVSG